MRSLCAPCVQRAHRVHVLGDGSGAAVHIKGNGGAVFPEPLERVEQALFFVEDVHNDITEVEQHPTAFCPAFATQGLSARENHLIFDLGGDGLNVAFIAAGHQEEDVGQGQRTRNVERNKIFALLRVSGGGRHLGERESAIGSCHGVLRKMAEERSTQNSPFAAATTKRPMATTAMTIVVATRTVVIVLLDERLPVMTECVGA